MKCLLPNGGYVTVTWRAFAPACTVQQIASNSCSTLNQAYVAAVTVCNQRLF
jgi:hypothetical protein